ncbi:acyl-CoA N-acyltransferase [Bombardia bombarda]|uniref:Acyl-CoA N-acyltransferase n=1 Tax=Bombardia bombarda TaxID=252184 RepID=A0AA40C9P9_9PEZI|nr:acyl-CoA N-acyltransferase [Bombardia bombarda]
MATWTIKGVTTDDAIAVALNNGRAFWHQPMWRMVWPKDITREYLIEQLTKRMPMRLLRDRDAFRHQKAVDNETGALLGYARWKFPESLVAAGKDGKVEWAEAQVPEVSADQEKAFKERQDSAWWKPSEEMNAVDTGAQEVKERILGEKEYIVLDYLAVNPDNQGKGVASSLVESGMEEARRLGFPIFVYGFLVARNLYLRLGFTEVETVVESEENGVYFMIYEVPKAA